MCCSTVAPSSNRANTPNVLPVSCATTPPLMRRRDLVSLLSTVPPFPSPSYELEQYKTSSEMAADIVSSIQAKYGGVEGKLVCDLGCGTGILGMGASALGAAFVLGVDIDAEALECARGSAEECGVGESMDFILADVSTFEGGVGVVGPFPLDPAAPAPAPAAGALKGSGGGGNGPVPLEEEGGLPPPPPLSVTASAMRSSLASWQGRFDTVIMNPPFGTRAPGVDVLFLRAALALVHREGHVFSLHKSSTRAHLLKSAQSWGVGGEAVAQLKFSVPATYAFHREKDKDVEVDLIHLFKKAEGGGGRGGGPPPPPPSNTVCTT